MWNWESSFKEPIVVEEESGVNVGGVVLCGGQSRRMGQGKATLPFGREVMLTRVLRLLGEVVDPLVVVAAPTQDLPELPNSVRVARDRTEGRGPLEGLYCGLKSLPGHVDAAYVTACDVPLLQAEFARYLIEKLGRHDVVVPMEGKFYHPLAAVYRTQLVQPIADRLRRDQLRMDGLYDNVDTCRVDVEELKEVDPALRSLMNLNSPEDYQAALQLAGLQP